MSDQAFTIEHLHEVLTGDVGFDVSADDLAEPHATFAALGVDSLGVFELFSVIENRFGVVVADEAIEHLTCPVDVVDHINDHLAAAA